MGIDNGIDGVANDAAVRALLRPDAELRSGEVILPGIDASTGGVSRSGSGTGGGNAGEDYDDDHAAGSNTNT